MALDIFEHRFGDAVMPVMDDESRPQIGMAMLNCVQTVVDVIADKDNNGYTVGFAPTVTAFTEHKKRQIVISGTPLFTAPVGTPLRDIAAILTGFAVHEVGHTRKIGIIDAARAEWPGKVIPKTLANMIEDVVLEERTIRRYAGFREVFRPTLEYVARVASPAYDLAWEGSTGHKVNLVGQIVRYREFVRFANDPVTQQELLWWEEWTAKITYDLTPKGGVALIHEALDRLHSQRETNETDEEPPVQPPLPPKGEGEPLGPPKDGLPDEEDDDEPKPKPGEGKGEPTEGGDDDGDDEPTEGEDGDDGDGDGEDGDTEGGSEGDGDSEPDDDTEGGDGEGGSDDDGDTEGETDGDPDNDGQPGEGDGENATDGGEIDLDDRPDLPKGGNDSDGGGGSGEGVSEADPDDGLDETELDSSFDDVSQSDNSYRDQRLEGEIAEERVTTRMNAGAHGKMKVVWR
jgi:hypothetical protein